MLYFSPAIAQTKNDTFVTCHQEFNQAKKEYTDLKPQMEYFSFQVLFIENTKVWLSNLLIHEWFILIVIIIILFMYCWQIFSFLRGWYLSDAYTPAEQSKNLPFISILVSFRNEAQNIQNLLNSIKKLSYPANSFEVIFSDDHSEDDSINIIKNTNMSGVNILVIAAEQGQKKGKKGALHRGIAASKGDIILTTDADCIVKENWLKHTGNYFMEKPEINMLIGPVEIIPGRGIFSVLQTLEFLSIAGSTAGSALINKPLMNNGANLAFRKSIYNQLYHCIPGKRFATGDDIFLMQCIKRNHPKTIHYLKNRDSIVSTSPEKSIKSFLQQRIRWASKSRGYEDKAPLFTGVIVALINIITMLLILSLFCTSFADYRSIGVLFLSIRFLTDLALVSTMARFFNKLRYLPLFPLLFVLYPFYVSTVAVASLFNHYQWKGRKY